MALSDFFKKGLLKSEAFKQAQEERRIQNILDQREKSSNEREYDRFIEEEREKSIKQNLEEFRKMRQKEINSMNILKGKNIFKGKSTMLNSNSNMLSMHGMLNGGNLFLK